MMDTMESFYTIQLVKLYVLALEIIYVAGIL
jgi:hypothetical protein